MFKTFQKTFMHDPITLPLKTTPIYLFLSPFKEVGLRYLESQFLGEWDNTMLMRNSNISRETSNYISEPPVKHILSSKGSHS